MPILRRTVLRLAASLAAVPALARAQNQPAAQPDAAQAAAWKTPRGLGSADAKTEVQEFFSLTCTHCAAFAQTTFPRVEKDLIGTGKVRWVFRDFPLDRVALQAAMVARALPPERYTPFVLALLSSQDRWAFAQGVDSRDEIWKMAALAGMSRATFEAAWDDAALRDWILAQQAEAEKKYGIDSTPSFLVNGKKAAGEMDYNQFAKLIANA
ncbi:MAG: DsbA family protein [Acetobacteraceae bacterium]|nr:DsbA family protein [Acetobacteraceae bacterium]